MCIWRDKKKKEERENVYVYGRRDCVKEKVAEGVFFTSKRMGGENGERDRGKSLECKKRRGEIWRKKRGILYKRNGVKIKVRQRNKKR